MRENNDIRAIVPAAGASRRMGTCKLQLDFGGETVLQKVVRNLARGGVHQITVVVRSDAGSIRTNLENYDVHFVINSDPDRGMLSSIQEGILHSPIPDCGWLIVLADQPMIDPTNIQKIVEVASFNQDKLVFPIHNAKRGHPIFIPKIYREELLALPPDAGLHALTRKYAEGAILLEVNNENIHFDLDTPDDYERALNRRLLN